MHVQGKFHNVYDVPTTSLSAKELDQQAARGQGATLPGNYLTLCTEPSELISGSAMDYSNASEVRFYGESGLSGAESDGDGVNPRIRHRTRLTANHSNTIRIESSDEERFEPNKVT
jgi:hypothetical protein